VATFAKIILSCLKHNRSAKDRVGAYKFYQTVFNVHIRDTIGSSLNITKTPDHSLLIIWSTM
jgi:hypothetical protein